MSVVLQQKLIRLFAAMTLVVFGFAARVQLALAQEGGGSGGGTGGGSGDLNVDVKMEDGGGPEWYGNWWVWAIGIAVFLIIIVALTNRGGRDRD